MDRTGSLTLGLSFAILGALAANRPLSAQPVPLGPEQAVNELTTSSDFDPAIGVSDAGDVLVVWSRFEGDGDGIGIFGRLTPAGNPSEDEFAVNTFTTGPQFQPDVGMNGSGDFALVWSSLGQVSETSSFDLIARQSSADGTTLSDEFLAEELTADSGSDGAVASDAEDGFVTAWLRDSTVVARQFDTAGNPGSELTVAVGSVNVKGPDVAVDAQRGFVVIWEDADSDNAGIWGRIYEELGANPSTVFRVNADETGDQKSPSVGMAANGEFVVVWDDFDGSFVTVEGRRFKPDGTPVGGDFPISPDDGNDHTPAEIDGHADGGFVVVWTGQAGGDGAEPEGTPTFSRVFSREYQRTAQPVGEAFEEAAQPEALQFAPAVGVGEKVWTTAWVAPDADGDGIYSRSYLRRAIFADDFEGAPFDEVWSNVVP